MANIAHKLLTGTNLHLAGFVQATDPGAVGAGMIWVDTSGGTGNWLLKVRDVANTGWETVSSGGGGGGGATYVTAFSNASLVAGILPVTHALNNRVAHVVIVDNNYKTIIPDEITSTGVNTMQVDLSSYGTISGTWYVRVTL
jgi:hypothetical protein